MYPFITQALARQHQTTLVREARYERASRYAYKQTKGLSRQPLVLQSKSLSEPDFAAIRRDLRFTLSEWSLDPGTTSGEAALDTFMSSLRMRLGYHEQCRETKAIF